MNTNAIHHYLNLESIRQAVAELDAAGYEDLHHVLRRAFIQATHGKGKERHAQNLPFAEQPMQRLIDLYGVGFALGQAAKKAQESQRLPIDHAVNELLGAINYLAGAVIAIERANRTTKPAQEIPQPANDNKQAVPDADWILYDGTNPPPVGSIVDIKNSGAISFGVTIEGPFDDCFANEIQYRIVKHAK